MRNYDDGLGRFMSVDDWWEKYRSLSPYHYSFNNPLTLKDPSGFGWWSDRVQNAKDIGSGIADAVLSDLSGKNVRTGDQNSTLYQAAKFGTHVANAVVSAVGFVEGASETVVGVAGAPETFGASLALSAHGVAVMAASGTIFNNAVNNLMKSEGNGNGGGGDDDERNWKQDKMLGNKELKDLGIDAHSVKQEVLGKKAKISQYDLYKDRGGNIYVKRKGGQEAGIETGYNVNDFK